MLARLSFAVAVVAGAAALQAQSIPPSQMVHAEALRSMGDVLLTKARNAADGVGLQILLTRPDGSEQLIARVKSGQGEWHHDFADILICLDGEAEVLTGGGVVDGKEIAPGEIRGSGVRGGQRESFRPGDVLRIEPQVAHQMLLQPGGTVRYLAVKVRTAQ